MQVSRIEPVCGLVGVKDSAESELAEFLFYVSYLISTSLSS